jgi:hypothetical protein
MPGLVLCEEWPAPGAGIRTRILYEIVSFEELLRDVEAEKSMQGERDVLRDVQSPQSPPCHTAMEAVLSSSILHKAGAMTTITSHISCFGHNLLGYNCWDTCIMIPLEAT